MSLRAGVLLAAVAAFFSAGPLAANAQDYPSRPIKLLIHTPPGSLVDVLGRLVGQELGERLGQSLISDNRVGGATMIAVEQLKNSPADGYTLMINTSEATMLPFLQEELSHRSDQGFHADRAGRDLVDGVRGQSEGAGEQHCRNWSRIRRATPAGALRLGRHRRRAAHRGRDAQAQERRQFRPRAVSRRRAGRDRCDLGPDRDGVDGACIDARRRRRAAQDCRADRPEPASDAAGRADHSRGRPCQTCAWTPGSAWSGRRECQGDRRAASTKSLRVMVKQQAFQDKALEARIGGGFQAGRRVHFIHGRRYEEVARTDPGDGHSVGGIGAGELMAKKSFGEKAENADLAERQEGRRLDHGDVRDLA